MGVPGAAVAVAAGPAQVTAAVAVQPTPSVSAQASVAPATGASAQAAAAATPAAKPAAAVSVSTPSATVATPTAPTSAPSSTTPANPATTQVPRASVTRSAPRKAHRQTTSGVTGVAAAEHTVRKTPASRRADAPPFALANARALSPAAAHPQADAGAASSQDSPLPAWPQAPAGTFGLGGAAFAGASSPLLLFALTLMFVLFALPSFGSPLPIRLRGLRSASPRFRLERPG